MSCASSNFISIYSYPPKIQNFSLPENIIFYISKNPKSVQVYNKLVNLCKYFYFKYQIITFDHSMPIVNGITNNRFISKTPPNKFWLCGTFKPLKRNILESVIEKFYRCDLTSLILQNLYLSFEEFIILSSSGTIEKIDFKNSAVDNEYRTNMKIEELIKSLPKLKFFKYNSNNSSTSKTVKKLFKIPHFQNLKVFDVSNLPKCFNFESFFDKLKKPWTMQVDLSFKTIADDLKERIENFVDNIIEIGLNTENMPPIIKEHKYEESKNLRDRFINYSIKTDIKYDFFNMMFNLSRTASNFISIYSNPSKNQKFSFPETLVNYISKNSQSLKVYNKLTKTCKYFYLNSQIITGEYSKCIRNGINDPRYISKITRNNKIWLYGTLELCGNNEQFFVSSITKKIYRCDLTLLKLKNQNFSMDQLKILISSGTIREVILYNNNVSEKNGEKMQIEEIIQNLPNLKVYIQHEIYDHLNEFINIDTAKKLINIPHIQNLEKFSLSGIGGETFNFETFYDGLKKPCKIDIYLGFTNYFKNFSDYFKKRLQTVINNIIEDGLDSGNMPPLINFPGMNTKNYQELKDLRKTYVEKNKMQANNNYVF